MVDESNEHAESTPDDSATGNPLTSKPPAQGLMGIELKKRELLKTLAKGAFLVPAALVVLTNNASAAASNPQPEP